MLLVVVAAGFGAWMLAVRWHPSDSKWPRQGIDVSHHQGAIDWAALPAQGVDFAYIKASEGGDHRDSRLAENWAGAKKAGIARGAYHFFTLCRSGAEQAANFLAALPADPRMLPPALDLEFLGNCRDRPAMNDVIGEVMAFIRPVEAKLGEPVTLYLTAEFDQAYHISARIPRPLWLRSLVREPGWGARPWAIWQVSNFRMLRGISGRVDWNVARP
jgi:lysozyme